MLKVKCCINKNSISSIVTNNNRDYFKVANSLRIIASSEFDLKVVAISNW